MKNPTKSAMIVIDMERGFIEPESAHCIRTAKATVPACSRAMAMAREKGIPVFLVNRIYRANGCDVESTRYHAWVAGGRAMTPGSTGVLSYEMPEGMEPPERPEMPEGMELPEGMEFPEDVEGFVDGTFNTNFLKLSPAEREKNLAIAHRSLEVIDGMVANGI